MLVNFFQWLDNKFLELLELLSTPFVELTIIELLLVFAVAVCIVYFIKYSVKEFFSYGVEGLKVAYRPIVIMYKKNKAYRHNKRVCHVCKNPLDKCTCQSNRGVSYHDRVVKWKINEKALNSKNKEQVRETREVNKPVELKKKSTGGR